jgi:hypothetical protein
MTINSRQPTTYTLSSTFAQVASFSTGYVPKAITMKRQSSAAPYHHDHLRIHNTSSDAADLVRTIFRAVKYIHDSGIVHRGAYSLPQYQGVNMTFFFHRFETRKLAFSDTRRRSGYHDRRFWSE